MGSIASGAMAPGRALGAEAVCPEAREGPGPPAPAPPARPEAEDGRVMRTARETRAVACFLLTPRRAGSRIGVMPRVARIVVSDRPHRNIGDGPEFSDASSVIATCGCSQGDPRRKQLDEAKETA
jgi:hypothetical protein